MTTDSNAGDGRAELFVADFYPKLGEYLAQRHASGYDAVAARARFLFWLAQHVDKTTIGPPPADPGGAGGVPDAPLNPGDVMARDALTDHITARIPIPMARVIGEIAVVQRRLSRELGREPTPEELAAELGMRPPG